MDLCITGLIRHEDSKAIKNLEKMKKGLKPENFSMIYWNYLPNAKVPTTNHSAPIVYTSDAFLKRVIKSTDAVVIANEPVSTEDSLNWVHPQVATLQLSPNPKATLSWLSALAHASHQLGRSETPENLWFITRPDFYSTRYFLFLTRKTLERLEKNEDVVFVAKRPYAHNVLSTYSGFRNLPIDHFYIGYGKKREVFTGLPGKFHEVIKGNDKRQPLVNEFLIAQFLSDQNVKLVEFPLPYLLRRDSWLLSLVPNGQNRFRKVLATIRNLKFFMKLIIQLHIVFLRPKLLNKNLI